MPVIDHCSGGVLNYYTNIRDNINCLLQEKVSYFIFMTLYGHELYFKRLSSLLQAVCEYVS